MPGEWVELKSYEYVQDNDARFPIELDERNICDIIEDLRRILGEATGPWEQVRFSYREKHYGYGAYTSWWVIEGLK